MRGGRRVHTPDVAAYHTGSFGKRHSGPFCFFACNSRCLQDGVVSGTEILCPGHDHPVLNVFVVVALRYATTCCAYTEGNARFVSLPSRVGSRQWWTALESLPKQHVSPARSPGRALLGRPGVGAQPTKASLVLSGLLGGLGLEKLLLSVVQSPFFLSFSLSCLIL